ncbi:tetratricopeptide repeat protein [Dyella choica]|uniref:Sel1 repeat family protein n=1 Tax=Dyella choica TaxID=1927959 RepID=A0A3S0S1C8_9GAMM|nr:tetratricopeptide repeat protein [Dyella choica]RUL77538.1 sel1 repeat family protein [Dyella choica]
MNPDNVLPPLPKIPGLVPQDTANPYAKPGAQVTFKEFASDFMLFVKKHCRIQSAAESDALAQTRTSFRKESITRAGDGAPAGSQVLKLHETTRVTYHDAPATPNLNPKGLEALGIINAMRRESGGSREADWWLTFSPAPDTEDGWRFEYAEVQEATAEEEDPTPRERVDDCEWILDVLAARKEIAMVFDVAYEHHYGTSSGGKIDLAKAVMWYHRAAALTPGPGPYVDKYRDGFSFRLHAMFVNGSAAKCNLADKYEHGKGVPQDYQRALFWYNESAKQDNGVAEDSLAHMFADGRGVARDIDAAIALFQRAIAHGYARGGERLAQLRKEKARSGT